MVILHHLLVMQFFSYGLSPLLTQWFQLTLNLTMSLPFNTSLLPKGSELLGQPAMHQPPRTWLPDMEVVLMGVAIILVGCDPP